MHSIVKCDIIYTERVITVAGDVVSTKLDIPASSISDIILITNKTIYKKSSHNPYTQDYAKIFCIVFNWCLV